MVVEHIDPSAWQHVDLKGPAQVKLLQPQHPGEIVVRLPHKDNVHRWVSWRRFKRISTVTISKD
jgi:hypothetical protein